MKYLILSLLVVSGMMVAVSCFAQMEGESQGTQASDTSLAGALKALEAPVEEEAPSAGLVARMRNSGLVTLFIKGGMFMWPLLISSIIGVAVVIERFITLTKARTDVKKLMKRVLDALHSKGIEAAASECERTRGPIAAILHAGLKRADQGADAVQRAIETAGTIETSFLERGLIWLASVTSIAPLLGFLGTVSGMIRAFNAIAEAEQVNAKLVASGISEALITTATGLIIAIPIQAFHNYFVSVIDRFVIEMEEASADLIDTISVLQSGGTK